MLYCTIYGCNLSWFYRPDAQGKLSSSLCQRGILQSELNMARLSLWEPARQNLKPQSEIMSTTTVVINLLCHARFSRLDSVRVSIKRGVWLSFDSSSGKNGSLSRCIFQSGGANSNHGGIRGVQKKHNSWKKHCCCQQGQRGLTIIDLKLTGNY